MTVRTCVCVRGIVGAITLVISIPFFMLYKFNSVLIKAQVKGTLEQLLTENASIQ